jgi:PAS domain-containing protein
MSIHTGDDDKAHAQKAIDDLDPTGVVVKLRQLYTLFTKLWTPVQLLLAAGGLIVAVYYGKALWHSLLNTQRSIALALAAKLEPTRNTDQGIAAFLLSQVRGDWAKAENFNTAELNSILQDIQTKVQEETAAASAKETSGGRARPGVARQPPQQDVPEMLRKLGLRVENSESNDPWRTAIVSKPKERFMVVPATSLRRPTLAEAALDKDDPARLAEVLRYNPEILFDLRLASELEPLMRRMDSASGERLKVIQTYFITESGVFLIRANGVKDQGQYYWDEFQPYTQYMDRPYFWGAVDIRAGQRKPTPFDYGTKPYLDLGGNGFVVTFSKRFMLPNQRVAVLCVDAKLPDYVTDEIKNHMKSLGADVGDFYWIKDKGVEGLPENFSWFTEQLNTSREARSQVLGTVATEPAGASPTQARDEAARVVRFTVPVASGEYGDGIKRTRLLWVEFDSGSIQGTLFKNLILFTAGIILVIAVTWSLLWDYTVLKREMSNVLKKMSEVMRDASTPFVWLNEKNEFKEVNNSFLKVLGYENDNIDGLKRERPTFRSLVTGQTRHVYEDVLAKSAAGGETGEYELDVITKTGQVLRVRAHGERIPYPTPLRRGIPHRFGIFVKVIGPVDTAEPEPATRKPNKVIAVGAHR